MTKNDQKKLNKVTVKLLNTLSQREREIILLNAEYGSLRTAQKLGLKPQEIESEINRLKIFLLEGARKELPKLRL